MTQYRVNAYHGTIRPFAECILNYGEFKPSTKRIEWLGNGIYFFENLEDAVWWANTQKKRHGKEGIVLSSILCCNNDQFMDLDKAVNLKKIINYAKRFTEGLEKQGKMIPRFSSENIDALRCFWCNVYKREHPNIKLLAYTFETATETNVGFRFKQRQFCAVDNSVISEIKEVTS